MKVTTTKTPYACSYNTKPLLKIFTSFCPFCSLLRRNKGKQNKAWQCQPNSRHLQAFVTSRNFIRNNYIQSKLHWLLWKDNKTEKQIKWYKLVQTSIASERPGIAVMSPPTTLSVKSSFFCKQRNLLSCFRQSLGVRHAHSSLIQ